MEWWGFLFVWNKGKRKARGKYDHIDRLLCRIFSQKTKRYCLTRKMVRGKEGPEVLCKKLKIKFAFRYANEEKRSETVAF